MPSPSSNLFNFNQSSCCSTHSGQGYKPSGRKTHGEHISSRLTEPFDMPYGDFTSPPRCKTSGISTSQRELHNSRYNYRDISPNRSSERPRALTDKHAYDDHRSVSPLGASRFEQPSETSRLFGSRGSSRSSAHREGSSSRDSSRFNSFKIDRGYDECGRASASGNGLVHSSTSRDSIASRCIGDAGEYGLHLGRERRQHLGSNFREGGFDWGDF